MLVLESGEQKLQRLIENYNQLIVQREMLRQQLSNVTLATSQIEADLREKHLTRLTLDELKNAKEEHEVLISLGTGAFVNAKLGKVDEIIYLVGAGVAINKTIDEATQSIEERISELQENLGKLQEALTKTDESIRKIEERLKELGPQIQNLDAQIKAKRAI